MKWAELKPSLIFLGKFLGFYLVANLAYGWWVTGYDNRPDAMTVLAANHSAALLNTAGYDVTTATHDQNAAQRILLDEHAILSVYEGCNGVNVWIIFTGFLFAFSTLSRRLVVFWLVGTAVIYLVNQLRIILLFFVALDYPDALYFVHKYLFTAVIYAVVFGMWYLWIIRYGKTSRTGA